MAKKRNSGSKKFIATLPYLVVPSDKTINQMETEFSLQVLHHIDQANTEQEERFLDWHEEIKRAKFDYVIDDNYQVYGYQASEYWGDDGWDLLEELFCPEQAIVQEIPLRGLKHPARKALLKEYHCTT